MNDTQLAQLRSIIDKKASTLNDKKISFEDPITNVHMWFKDNVKNYAQENGRVVSLEKNVRCMQTDFKSATQAVPQYINIFKDSKYHK